MSAESALADVVEGVEGVEVVESVVKCDVTIDVESVDAAECMVASCVV